MSHRAGGSGDLGSNTASDYLWTLIGEYRDSRHVMLRLSDGNVSQSADSSPRSYRCIWPSQDRNHFVNNSCYGPPDSACQAFGRIWNVDQWSRPPADLVAATQECNFYNARVVTISEVQEIIDDGWPIDRPNDSMSWHWSPDFIYWYSGGYGAALYRWDDSTHKDWSYSHEEEAYGSYASSSSGYRFRCIGKQDLAWGQLPVEEPACQDGQCFSSNLGGNRLIADNVDRPAGQWKDAFKTCKALGGDLPSSREVMQLSTHS